jgi:hypothetical protein
MIKNAGDTPLSGATTVFQIEPLRIADSSQQLNSSTSQLITPATECAASEKRCREFPARKRVGALSNLPD